MATNTQYKTSLTTTSMQLEQALRIARGIQTRHPEWALCGSVAMILTGMIPERDVHDIDFVMDHSDMSDTMRSLIALERAAMTKDERDYDIAFENAGQYYYRWHKMAWGCLFIIKDLSIARPTFRFGRLTGLILQSNNQMYFWKDYFGRKKDTRDLSWLKAHSSREIPVVY